MFSFSIFSFTLHSITKIFLRRFSTFPIRQTYCGNLLPGFFSPSKSKLKFVTIKFHKFYRYYYPAMTRKHKLDNQKPISDVSKEPSGAQKRKKQKEIEDKDKKLRKQAERFFKSPTQPHSDISVVSCDTF